jgi:hypothetical protein
MADLFTRAEVDFGGAFHSQRGIITPIGTIDVGVLMQNLNLTYMQQVTRIYELGSSGRTTKCYYIAGRSQGTITAGHVIGPGVALAAFYKAFSDVCQARCNTLDLNLGPNNCDADCVAGGVAEIVGGSGLVKSPNSTLRYTAKFCVLTQIGMSVQAQDFVINENSQIMFTGLEFSGI